MVSMVFLEILRRLGILIKILFVFALISLINGLIIRIIIKGAAVVIYPILWLQQCCYWRNGFHNRAGFYQSLGQTGALSAYLDRHEMSKFNLFLSIILGLLIYYMMYISIQQLQTTLTFGETYSGIIND